MTHICEAVKADEGTQHYARACDGSQMQEGDVTIDDQTIHSDYCIECLNRYWVDTLTGAKR